MREIVVEYMDETGKTADALLSSAPVWVLQRLVSGGVVELEPALEANATDVARRVSAILLKERGL